ncbi:hypothetical protein ABZV78_03040 [Micromonospora sp. NPDC004540]|uniref:hypothetical protein n=1 Tax=Micromonospora sp. NPDC004540 TaxID=3154457 RepID=UPI0033B5851D
MAQIREVYLTVASSAAKLLATPQVAAAWHEPVEGEAGIGKSRQLREWLAAPDQHTALVSVCPPLRESLTLGPIVDAFRRIDRPLSRLRLTELAGALRPLFPE